MSIQEEPQNARAIASILSGATMQEAAKAAGVSRSTLYRWLKEPSFVSALNAARAIELDRVRNLLTCLAESSLVVLQKALLSADTPTSLKVRVADIILARLIQIHPLGEVEQRLYKLELITHELLLEETHETGDKSPEISER